MARKVVYTVDGDKLTSLRLNANLSIDDVCLEIRCNRGSLSRWERGLCHPSEVYIMRLIMLHKRFDFVKRVGGGSNGN